MQKNHNDARRLGAYKVALPLGERPEVPNGWAAFEVGPALDLTPTIRTVRRRGPNGKGTVAPMTVEQFPEYWVVYDPYRCTVHSIEDKGHAPVGSVPVDAIYGISVHPYQGRLAARFARFRDRRNRVEQPTTTEVSVIGALVPSAA